MAASKTAKKSEKKSSFIGDLLFKISSFFIIAFSSTRNVIIAIVGAFIFVSILYIYNSNQTAKRNAEITRFMAALLDSQTTEDEAHREKAYKDIGEIFDKTKNGDILKIFAGLEVIKKLQASGDFKSAEKIMDKLNNAVKDSDDYFIKSLIALQGLNLTDTDGARSKALEENLKSLASEGEKANAGIYLPVAESVINNCIKRAFVNPTAPDKKMIQQCISMVDEMALNVASNDKIAKMRATVIKNFLRRYL